MDNAAVDIIVGDYPSEAHARSAARELEASQIPFTIERREDIPDLQPWVIVVDDPYSDTALDTLHPDRSRHHTGRASPEQYQRTERALAANRERHQLEAEIVDPLRPVTRKERTSLLAVSTLGVAVAFGGLVPEEINALGIRMSHLNQAVLLAVLLTVVAYYRVAFALYARADIARWNHRFHRLEHLLEDAGEVQCATCHEIIRPEKDRDPKSWRGYISVFRRRGVFDAVVPRLAGNAAIVSLAWRIWRVLHGGV